MTTTMTISDALKLARKLSEAARRPDFTRAWKALAVNRSTTVANRTSFHNALTDAQNRADTDALNALRVLAIHGLEVADGWERETDSNGFNERRKISTARSYLRYVSQKAFETAREVRVDKEVGMTAFQARKRAAHFARNTASDAKFVWRKVASTMHQRSQTLEDALTDAQARNNKKLIQAVGRIALDTAQHGATHDWAEEGVAKYKVIAARALGKEEDSDADALKRQEAQATPLIDEYSFDTGDEAEAFAKKYDGTVRREPNGPHPFVVVLTGEAARALHLPMTADMTLATLAGDEAVALAKHLRECGYNGHAFNREWLTDGELEVCVPREQLEGARAATEEYTSDADALKRQEAQATRYANIF